MASEWTAEAGGEAGGGGGALTVAQAVARRGQAGGRGWSQEQAGSSQGHPAKPARATTGA